MVTRFFTLILALYNAVSSPAANSQAPLSARMGIVHYMITLTDGRFSTIML